MAKFAVVLPAAGQSTRFGATEKKPYIQLEGRAVWQRTAELFANRDDVVQMILVISPEDRELVEYRHQANLMFLGVKLVDGGSERFESVANALATVREDVDFVVVHDAVRPCTKPTDIDRVFATAEKYGAALLGIPVADTLKRLDEDRKIIETVPRRGLWQAQTPQIGRKDWLLDAYAKRSNLKAEITDDAQLLEAMGHPVIMVEGSPTNLKITTKDDMLIAQAVLAAKFGDKIVKQYHPFADEDGNW